MVSPNDLIQSADDQQQEKQEQDTEQTRLNAIDDVKKTIIEATNALLQTLTGKPITISQTQAPKDVTVNNLGELSPDLKNIVDAVNGLELNPVFDPKIKVSPAPVNVTRQEIDVKPIVNAVNELIPALEAIKNKPDAETELDLSPIVKASETTTKAIQALRFPVPNFVQDPLIRYKIADVDDDNDDTTVNYFGFVNPEGNWYIQKEDKTANPATYRYAYGNGNGSTQNQYPRKWTDRATQHYDYFNLIFP